MALIRASKSLYDSLGLEYSDVYIEPQYSEVLSREHVDTSTYIGSLSVSVPVISANMDTVTDGTMAAAIWKAGAIGAIHRFMSIEENVEQFKIARAVARCFVSVGVMSEDSKERARRLYAAGARFFIIDIAHGHSKMMAEMIKWMRNSLQERVFIMAGNVATEHAVDMLVDCDVDAIKVGIGPGAVCTTKNVTGVTVPQFSAVWNCASHLEKISPKRSVLLVADGGVSEIGDIAKALGAGADLVMCGRLFAPAAESPGPRLDGQKIYRGMASRDAMLTIRAEKDLPTPEGISTVLNDKATSVANIVSDIKGGLQSALSYSNSRNLAAFKQNCRFGVRYSPRR